MCKYHVLFIDVSINGPLCCFHLLVLVNSVVMNLGVEISYQDSLVIVLDIHTNQVVIVFNFLRHLHFFFCQWLFLTGLIPQFLCSRMLMSLNSFVSHICTRVCVALAGPQEAASCTSPLAMTAEAPDWSL